MTKPRVRPTSAVVVVVLLAGLLAGAPVRARVHSHAGSRPRDGKAEVTALLQEFLAKVGSPAMHERFWADDLVYVSNAGVARTKAGILAGMKEGPSGGYTAEDVVVRQFGDVVVLNFRLVQHTPGKPDASYRNSGVFVLRGGRWQAVSWQATRVAPAT